MFCRGSMFRRRGFLLWQNMKSALLFSICIIFACLASFNAEDCLDCGVEFHRSYITEGQPGFVHCPLCYQLDDDRDMDYNFTWSKNGSIIHVTTERHARIYQDGSMMKFVPATLEDSGYYQCTVWNATDCFKKLVKVIVFKNDNGLCYNSTTKYPQQDAVEGDRKVVCADLSDYVHEYHAQIRWYKECELLDISGSKFNAIGYELIVKNVTKNDAGNYTCEITYAYDGKLYNISRSIDWTLIAFDKRKPAVITYPKNNSIEVELGSPVSLVCNASYRRDDVLLFWIINDMYAEDYDNNSRAVAGISFESTLEDRTTLMTVYLNISEVKKEDYENKIACVLQSGNGENAIEFLFIKRPVPNFQGGLIAIFVALAFVIVIAILTYKVFKVDIVLWHRQNCLCHSSKEDGKIYDAYVMFPKSIYPVDTFVLKVLPEVLERQCGYKLFIFGRDELPGEAIADVVDQTINESRRLIIILAEIKSSDDFFEDAFEQQIALYDALVSNKVKAVLIELEKIVDYTNMPESIKYIKQKQGVIRWKGNFTDSSLLPNTRFWKNVRYRMPPTRGLSSQTLHSKPIPPLNPTV